MSSQRPCICEAPKAAALRSLGKRPDCCAIVLAGGRGERFGAAEGKQFVELCGLPLACWSLMAFDRAPSVGHIVVVVSSECEDSMREDVLGRISLKKDVTLAPSGATRQDSVFSGLSAVPQGFGLVAVHDSARPLVEPKTIEGCIACVRADDTLAGAICANPSTDTLKLVEGRTIVATPDRSFYWAAQTPQVFRARQLMAAHKAARREGYVGTDDASLVERRGGRVACVPSPKSNIKVTVPDDYVMAQVFLERRLISEGCGIDPDAAPQDGGTDAAHRPRI